MRCFHRMDQKVCMSAAQGRSAAVSLRIIGRYVNCLVSAIKYLKESNTRGRGFVLAQGQVCSP